MLPAVSAPPTTEGPASWPRGFGNWTTLDATSNAVGLLANGGRTTLASYGTAAWDRDAPPPIPAAHIAWLAALPLMHVDLHRVYVHAAADRWRPLHRQRKQTLLWDLYPEDDEGGHGDFHVVHGHEQVAAGPVLRRHRTNLDTFAWRTGRLVVGGVRR